MRVTRTAYYCAYTKSNDELPRFTPPFSSEAGARGAARRLARQGFWGAIEKHHEWKEDYQNESAWLPDWERAGDGATRLIEYF
jgi:hypothetical protein